MLEGDGGEGGRGGREGEGIHPPTLPHAMLPHIYHISFPQERIAHGPPEADSDREKEFQRNLQSLKDIVRRIVQARREGQGGEELPFIDALLQSGVPEEQVGKLLRNVHLCNMLFFRCFV